MNQHHIETVAESLSDYLTQLGVNPDERPEHGGESIAEVLARVAIRSMEKLASTQLEAQPDNGLGPAPSYPEAELKYELDEEKSHVDDHAKQRGPKGIPFGQYFTCFMCKQPIRGDHRPDQDDNTWCIPCSDYAEKCQESAAQLAIDSWDDKHGPTPEELETFCAQFPEHHVAVNHLKWLAEQAQATPESGEPYRVGSPHPSPSGSF